VRRSQQGNNNAWCQDNEISWLDWTFEAQHADVLRFTKLLCAGRMLLDVDLSQGNLTLCELLNRAQRNWHGVKLGNPDWSVTSHSIALHSEVPGEDLSLYLILNAWREPLDFELPPADSGNPWRRWIDTGLDSPDDITEWKAAPPVLTPTWQAAPHSVAILYGCGLNDSGVRRSARTMNRSGAGPT
jgi:isoamylase